MNAEAPPINNETNHFHYEEPIGCCQAWALFIFSVFISLEMLLLGIFLSAYMLIFMAVGFFFFFAALIYCVNLRLRKYVIDIDVPKNEMVIQHVRMRIYCCFDNEKHTIYPLRDVITFSYSPGFSKLDKSTFTVLVRDGIPYVSNFSIPMEQIWRIDAILKSVNPALINDGMGENTRILHTGNYPSYSSNQYVHVPANNIPSNTPAPNVAGNNAMAPVSSATTGLTADQLGLLINQLQGQQMILLQQEQQRLGQGEGSNASVPGAYSPPVSLPVGSPVYASSSQMATGVQYPPPPQQYQNTYTNVGAEAQQGSKTESWTDVNK